MAWLIDTNVLISLERRRGELEHLVSNIPDDGEALLAAITAAELLAGVLAARTPQQRQERGARVEGILARVPVIPFDLPSARAYADAKARLASSGLVIGDHDLMIAGTALANGHGVLTENVSDFERVPGLAVRQFRL